MKYFTTDGDFLTPKTAPWYQIPIHQLSFYYADGVHQWLPHLSKKGWFSEDMFWELLGFAKQTFPDCDFDQAIFQSACFFGKKYAYEIAKIKAEINT